MQRSTSTSVPQASVPRMVFSPLMRVVRILHLPVPTNIPTSPTALFSNLFVHIFAAMKRLDLSTDPRKTLDKVSKHQFTVYNTTNHVVMFFLACFALYLIDSLFIKLLIPIAYTIGLLLPITSQFLWPATYILSWLLTFFSSRFIPPHWRPSIHVVLLPTLESVFFGANISDLLTRYTHPILDVFAWLPYGLVHFVIPFVVAAVLWVFGPKGAVQFWAKAFGLMMLWGVLIQLVVPCSAPCESVCERFVLHARLRVADHWYAVAGYEIIHGLTPANYGMPGSPGGLMRIDRIFGTSGYTNAFGSAPLIFGAFPSLHAGNATMEALTLGHFFPRFKAFYWAYVGVLYWSTMYLTHHYLIDVVGGGCLAMACFYYFMPKHFKDINTGIEWEAVESSRTRQAMEYEAVTAQEDGEYDIDDEIRKLEQPSGQRSPDDAGPSMSDQPYAQQAGQPEPKQMKRKVSWGATQILGASGEDGSRRDVEPVAA
jgi:membrane-associated phospholipid phosphatase